MRGEFLLAVAAGDLARAQRLLRDGIASGLETNEHGEDALCIAIIKYEFSTALWLVEFGGADMFLSVRGESIWFFILDVMNNYGLRAPERNSALDLLRAMLLRGDAPCGIACWSPSRNWKLMIREGVRLRERLPAYILQRRALLDAHCPLIAPLRALVSEDGVPTTTAELWATGLGIALQH
jgi:hypothetical protein